MAKKPDPVKDDLRAILTSTDIDTVIYKLAELAVEKRDAATENKAEADYWQRAIPILHDAEEKLSSL